MDSSDSHRRTYCNSSTDNLYCPNKACKPCKINYYWSFLNHSFFLLRICTKTETDTCRNLCSSKWPQIKIAVYDNAKLWLLLEYIQYSICLIDPYILRQKYRTFLSLNVFYLWQISFDTICWPGFPCMP